MNKGRRDQWTCLIAISDIKRFSWNEYLDAFDIHDTRMYQRGPRFSHRLLERLDKLDAPKDNSMDSRCTSSFIHGH